MSPSPLSTPRLRVRDAKVSKSFYEYNSEKGKGCKKKRGGEAKQKKRERELNH